LDTFRNHHSRRLSFSSTDSTDSSTTNESTFSQYHQQRYRFEKRPKRAEEELSMLSVSINKGRK
jgi:hypothetical protein